jgi:hypothetical protein
MAERDPQLAQRRDYPPYEQDYAAWLTAQIELLRQGKLDRVDVPNLLDEVTDLGISAFRSFQSAIEIVIAHMLKWDHQPEKRGPSWIASIDEHRSRIEQALETSPSYRRRIPEAVQKAYRPARAIASRQTKMPLRAFPIECPYEWGEIIARDHPETH